MPEDEASEVKVNQVLRFLREWKEGPRPPSNQKFDLTIDLLIERLGELHVGDNNWEEIS